MGRILPDDWRPVGIDDLEPQAWLALRHRGCISVVAGPGAGKTEFLAQRAVYLLETGLCPPPRRVLAISFKRAAAVNLAVRVRQRCPPELAERFVSLTFDAFTKGLVDRFLSVVPIDWQPTRPYDIEFPTRRQIQGFLDITRNGAPAAWQVEIAAIGATDFESRRVGSYRLPLVRTEPQTGVEYAIDRWWADQLRRPRRRNSLTFVSLNRLAELLLRAHPHILRALRATHPFVFIDEFQDTTYAQYDFLLSAFADDQTSITVVGDDKQRIMIWAGARSDSFRRYEADFAAARFSLQLNFRSSPDLVRIQHVVARALDPESVPTESRVTRLVDGDVAAVWISQTADAEANHLARWLANDMEERRTAPRDYALLVRQKAEDYEPDLATALAGFGLKMRNESRALGRTNLQDLLTDEFSRVAIALLRLGATRQSSNAWQVASAAVQALRAASSEDEIACRKADAELTSFVRDMRVSMTAQPNATAAMMLTSRVVTFLDLAAISRTYIEYSTGDLLDIMVEAFTLHLATSANGAPDWTACLDAFEGVAKIPLMTVHKSKGLEYDTIVFIGLDDQAWWSHTHNNPEGLATFFVALSRAKQRAVFAFCRERGDRRRVADLYQLLTDAGVPEIEI